MNLLNRLTTPFFYSVLAFLIYVVISSSVLWHGHLHEDAYILFEYVKHFSSGHGIVYFEGGEHAEGATDFLWFLLLSIATWLGVDTAIGANLLNGLGLALVVYLCVTQMPFTQKPVKIIFSLLITLLITFSQPTAASLGGFSALFYSSVALGLAYVYWQDKAKLLFYIPIISLVLALIRPDGLLIGAMFCVLGLYKAHRYNTLKSYLITSIFCFLVGAGYFFWRYWYFGYLLPLPLYVKVIHASASSGWIENINWLTKKNTIYVFLFVVISALWLNKQHKLRLLFASLPFLLLFIALGNSHQSQNIEYRFQAPIIVFLYFALSASVFNLFEKSKGNKRVFLFLCLFIFTIAIVGGKRVYKEYKDLTTPIYINYLPLALNEYLGEDSVIALTEAGRMAYWNNAQTYDLVGLNTAEVAVHGLTVHYLETLSPDLIFIHQAGTLNDSVNQLGGENHFFTIKMSALKPYIKDQHTEIAQGDSTVVIAALKTFEFLAQQQDFYIYLVKYGKQYSHVYALKKNGSLAKQDFERLLQQSFDTNNHLSYWQSRKN